MARQGLVQLYTGDGKGKTSAAMGAVLRALGQGLRVCVVQFLKGGVASGEVKALADWGECVQVFRFGSKPGVGQEFAWVDPQQPTQEDFQEAEAALARAREAINSGRYDMVVLDEINLACAWSLVKERDVLKMVAEKPKNVELILTGSGATPGLVACADLATEMVSVKHPFEQGIEAREGVEV
jgi:cob(I)alamin adenosyltransferase